MKRDKITTSEVNQCITDLLKHLHEKINKKGPGVLISSHEILGVITEEYYEALMDVHQNNKTELKTELLDIAVACIWGYISLNHKSKN